MTHENFTIRKARMEDLHSIAALEALCFPAAARPLCCDA